MSAYWRWPLLGGTRFENSLTQARDLLNSERSFLAGIRSSFLVILASTAVVLEINAGCDRSCADWILTGFTWALSIALPAATLQNYASTFDGYFLENTSVRNSSWLIAVFTALAVCAILIVAHEYLRASP